MMRWQDLVSPDPSYCEEYSRTWGNLNLHWSGSKPWVSGDGSQYAKGSYASPRGIVNVYVQDGDSPILRMDFIHGGRQYSVTWHEDVSDLAIARRGNSLMKAVLMTKGDDDT